VNAGDHRFRGFSGSRGSPVQGFSGSGDHRFRDYQDQVILRIGGTHRIGDSGSGTPVQGTHLIRGTFRIGGKRQGKFYILFAIRRRAM